jgi:hypothetical protein
MPAPAARPGAKTDQSDLWFLASESVDDSGHDAMAEKNAEPSTMLHAALTVAMTAFVIILVLVFLSLMTSLLQHP